MSHPTQARSREALDRFDKLMARLDAMVGELKTYRVADGRALAEVVDLANAAISDLARLAGSLGAPTWEGAPSRQNVELHFEELVERLATRNKAELIARYRQLADALSRGQIEHRVERKQLELAGLRDVAFAELSRTRELDEIPPLPRAPEGLAWLTWAWSLGEPDLTEIFDPLEPVLPALARFVREVEPYCWKEIEREEPAAAELEPELAPVFTPPPDPTPEPVPEPSEPAADEAPIFSFEPWSPEPETPAAPEPEPEPPAASAEAVEEEAMIFPLELPPDDPPPDA